MNSNGHSNLPFIFDELDDPRRDTANRRYEFIDILVIALCGMLSGADDWVFIAEYGKAKKVICTTIWQGYDKLLKYIESADIFGV